MRLFCHICVLGLCLALGTAGFAQTHPATPTEQGMASWYGADFEGQRAASGEVFDPSQLTAAHRTLPFGAKVRVRRTDSGASVIVRINDRGPFIESRIIDVSYAAARLLGMTNPGLAPVTLELLEGVPEPPILVSDGNSFFAVRAGAFRNPDNARRTRDLMEEKFGSARIARTGDFLAVLVGPASTREEAETLAAAVRRGGKEFESAFVVKLEAAPTAAE